MGLYPFSSRKVENWNFTNSGIDLSGNATSGLGEYSLPNKEQIIPIHSKLNIDQFILLPIDTDCPKLEAILNDNYKSEDIKEIAKEYSDINEIIANYYNISIDDVPHKINHIDDSITANLYEGYKIPDIFLANDTYKRLNEYSIKLLNRILFTPDELAKFQSSEFLRSISEQMHDKRNGNLNRKFMLYSAHDITVQAILFGLGLIDDYSQ